ncbi:hypothetical protein [Rubeoparvulum massiliense]|uniref:hypothetical protein n=1 Tax=Rubeoparvulum massiliense TaxID=1631346 RepID=UPI00065E4795|nr:hypothetical protein [Rubeoparvulum massiliense]
MSKKKSFPLRIDPKIYAAIERWAQDEFRSVNGQIEFLLRDALKRSGRLTQAFPSEEGDAEAND